MAGDPSRPAAARLGIARAASLAISLRARSLCGGDNSITYAGVRGLAAALEPLGSGRIGLLTVDAHHDLREPEPAAQQRQPRPSSCCATGLPGNCIAQVGISAFANQRALSEAAREAGIGVYSVDDVRARDKSTGWMEEALSAGL